MADLSVDNHAKAKEACNGLITIRQTSKHNMKLSCSIGSCLPNELRYSNRSEMCRRLFLQCSETLSENVYLIVTDHSAMFDEINMMQNG